VATSSIPHWLIGLLGVAILLAISVAFWAGTIETAARTQPEPDSASQPAWHSYTTDIFYKVRWRWDFGARNEVEHLACFCPHCDYQVSVHNQSAYAAAVVIAFHCDSCNRDLAQIEEPLDHVMSKVVRFIQQKVRNKSWAASQVVEP
jgi:hypothetical protein